MDVQTEYLYVDETGDGMRLDAFLAKEGAYTTRSAAAKRVAAGEVSINGVAARKSATVKAGDVVEYQVFIDPRVFDLESADIPLDVRYEDDQVLVISKQAGLVTHPADGHPQQDTLVNALIHHCGRENLCNVQGEQDRLGIVHRLDRDTSGLMLAAKTNEAGQKLMEDIADRDVDRHYLALVHGWIPLETGLVDAPIGRSDRDRLRMCVSDRDNARDAMTSFSVVKRFEAGRNDDGYTLIDCKLFTGRTHQIRVHMEYIKHPCVGDPVYGWAKHDNLGLDRQFLHSYKLAFTHPTTGERLQFEDTLPADLQRVIDELEARG
ncbi:RluA family pseudouridine synthase [Slackia heliotrinireducens]|uniref:Pseudouridine synthase n=1 Tax=Slackia heliotrinireducens (strain ATCC 29202 / DSM 20476 / NCTC 11029 / RHS 1) TaxID=471855 RepID=C7N5E0_SLAHD|nr:RluA family pseudouridine synthase [Slackia heliotrinireducens]ACV22125.1 pseudouridine synthase, RluA family [Slackia heliotrinireducens DSM 20476]VEH00152.1 Ribosomal large subunit pseudouridine synthase D [Slackia heliotrinireducens]